MHVEAAHNIEDIAGARATSADAESKEESHEIAQEDKPRSRIVAEYLAQGYALSDQAIMKAIDLDQKHGVSSKFTSALHNFDKKFNATERAKGLDENYQISNKAASGWGALSHYFEKALESPSGQKLRDFYAQTDKQVREVHAEARRLADLKLGKTGEESKAGEEGKSGETETAAPSYSEAAAAPPKA